MRHFQFQYPSFENIKEEDEKLKPRKDMVFFYDNGKTYTATNVTNWYMTDDVIVYDRIKIDRGIVIEEYVKVPKFDVVGLKIQQGNEITIKRFKKSPWKMIGGFFK